MAQVQNKHMQVRMAESALGYHGEAVEVHGVDQQLTGSDEAKWVGPYRMGARGRRLSRATFHVILSRDPILFRKPSETQGNSDRLLKRTMVEKNGQGINP